LPTHHPGEGERPRHTGWLGTLRRRAGDVRVAQRVKARGNIGSPVPGGLRHEYEWAGRGSDFY